MDTLTSLEGSKQFNPDTQTNNGMLAEKNESASMDALVTEGLRPVVLGLGLIYTFLTVTHILFLPRETAVTMASVSDLTAVLLLLLALMLTSRQVSPTWANAIAAAVAGLSLLNSLLYIHLTADPSKTLHIVLLMVGCGFFLLSHFWFVTVLAASFFGWVAVVWSTPPSSSWVHGGISLLLGAFLAIIIQTVQQKFMGKYDGLKDQDERRKKELEKVLVSTEEAQRSLATSMALGQRIASILDLDMLLNQVADLIKERFHCYYVGIFLLDESGDYLVSKAGTGVAGRHMCDEGFKLKVGEDGLVGWVGARRRPLRVVDVLLDERYLAMEDLPRTRSELALPLEMGLNLLGVLDMQSDKAGVFREDDVPFLQMLADQVAIAIQNASLYEAEKTRRLLSENLYEVGRAISGSLDLSEVLDSILVHLSEILRFDRAAVMLRVEGELETAAAKGFPWDAKLQRIKIKKNDVFEDIERTQQPLHLPDVMLRPDWQHSQYLDPARSWVGIPLIHSDQVIGMLSLARETVSPYSRDEIALAATFASQAAIAIHNARLYNQITQFNQELEERVHQRTEDLQAAYNQLALLDRAKSDFIGVTSHELRTPLTVLSGYTQMLQEDQTIQNNPFQLQLIDGIQSGVTRLSEIVNSMLDTAKIDSQAMEIYPSPVLLHSVIEFVYSGLESAFEERKLTLQVEDLKSLPPIQADPDAIRKVFYHLFVNAIKYTPDGGMITVMGRCIESNHGSETGGAVQVTIRDTGIGIEPAVKELIFEKFYQTGQVAFHSSGKIKFKGGGPGLGLAIARGIVEAHGGRIWVESPGYDEAACPGSEFHVLLPLNV